MFAFNLAAAVDQPEKSGHAGRSDNT